MCIDCWWFAVASCVVLLLFRPLWSIIAQITTLHCSCIFIICPCSWNQRYLPVCLLDLQFPNLKKLSSDGQKDPQLFCSGKASNAVWPSFDAFGDCFWSDVLSALKAILLVTKELGAKPNAFKSYVARWHSMLFTRVPLFICNDTLPLWEKERDRDRDMYFRNSMLGFQFGHLGVCKVSLLVFMCFSCVNSVYFSCHWQHLISWPNPVRHLIHSLLMTDHQQWCEQPLAFARMFHTRLVWRCAMDRPGSKLYH